MTAEALSDRGSAPVEAFPRHSSRGFLLGLSGLSFSAMLLAALIVCFCVPVTGRLSALLWTAPAWGSLTAVALVPLGGTGGKVVDWLPVGTSMLVRQMTGQTRFRRPAWRTRPAGTLALPGCSARLRLVADELTGAAMIHDPHARTLSAALRVSHGQFMMADPDEQTARTEGFAALGEGLASTGGIARFQVLMRSMADAGVGVRDHWTRARCPVADEVGLNYEQLLAQAGGWTERHETYLVIVLDLDKVKATVRSYGGGINGAAAVMRERMRAAEQLLAPAGLSNQGWLSPEELAVVIRGAYDPAMAEELQHRPELGDDLSDAGPMAVDARWTMLRTDSGAHKVLQITRWPRRQVSAGFLHSLVLVPGARMSFSLLFKPIPADRAERDAMHADSGEAAAASDRERIGRRNTSVHRREAQEAEQHLLDLDAGHSDQDFIGLVCVSAPDEESLDKAVEDVRAAITSAHCRARTMVAQQDAMFDAACLPLGLGVR